MSALRLGIAVPVFAALFVSACGGEGVYEANDADEPVEAIELSLEGISSRFEQNHIMSDDVFEGRLYGLNVAQVQAFLEQNPYGKRSWLADQTFNGKTTAELLVELGQEHDISPLILLVRMQAEQGLVSATSRPSNRQLNKALGCACPDNRPCDSGHAGFANQLECGARYLRVNYQRSQNREGTYFAVGKSKRTLDNALISPRNHATASFYNYTPWREGAQLTWSISRKYIGHVATLDPSLTAPTPWIGDACSSADQCTSNGSCFHAPVGGMCVTGCEGYCADRPGKGTTFCASLDGGQTGSCVLRAEVSNDFCGLLTHTERREMSRFIGSSSARPSTLDVCVPIAFDAPVEPTRPAEPVEPVTPEEPATPVEPEQPVDEFDEFNPDAFVGTSCRTDNGCNFSHGGEIGMCLGQGSAAMCSLECEGYCPDKDGHAPTFCVSLDGGSTGSCMPRAHDLNGFCDGIEGSLRVELTRHVGSTSARRISRDVCVPFLP